MSGELHQPTIPDPSSTLSATEAARGWIEGGISPITAVAIRYSSTTSSHSRVCVYYRPLSSVEKARERPPMMLIFPGFALRYCYVDCWEARREQRRVEEQCAERGAVYQYVDVLPVMQLYLIKHEEHRQYRHRYRYTICCGMHRAKHTFALFIGEACKWVT